jgi:quercetin dioxygenase-like cupin family protein
MPAIDLETVREFVLAHGVSARVVHTGNVSVANVSLAAGAEVPEHMHHHEQVVTVVDGEIEMTVNGEPVTLVPGKVLVLHPMVPHSARAIQESRVVDVFHPVREEYR